MEKRKQREEDADYEEKNYDGDWEIDDEVGYNLTILCIIQDKWRSVIIISLNHHHPPTQQSTL